MSEPTPTSTSTDPAAAGDGDPGEDLDQLGYSAALAELERILHELDSDDVDVDVLGQRVQRAAELLRLCRDRIARARFEVEQVVSQLDEAGAGGSNGGTGDGTLPDG